MFNGRTERVGGAVLTHHCFLGPQGSGIKFSCWEFSGCPVVRTQRFHCWGPGSIPGRGTKILQAVPSSPPHLQKFNIVNIKDPVILPWFLYLLPLAEGQLAPLPPQLNSLANPLVFPLICIPY